ncbi:MAG: hypothetical protein AABW67_02385 [Nanoarchaeota archaeon]
MKKRGIGKFKLRNYFSDLLIIFLIILIFTLIDAFIHSLSAEYAIPDYYFRNKIIFGTIIGFITYLFIKNKSLFTKSLIFSVVISVLLQIRYALEGYNLKFVIEFLFFHFLILLFTSIIIFKSKKYLKGGRKE